MTDDKWPNTRAAILERYDWKKVQAPRRWYPKDPGEEIVGFYGGKSVRNGSYGQYEVVLVHVPKRGALMLSGVRISQLIDAAGIQIGWPVRVVWKGMAKTAQNNEMKDFDLFVAEGDALDASDLPMVTQ